MDGGSCSEAKGKPLYTPAARPPMPGRNRGVPAAAPRPIRYMFASAYSARAERGTPCRVMCTPWGKSLKRSVR